MTTAVAITPASGAITHAKTVCRVDISGAPTNDSAAFDPTKYPTEPAIQYYIDFTVSSVQQGKSYIFTPNGGAHQFNNYIFPSAGTWTVALKKASDDSSVASISVVVA